MPKVLSVLVHISGTFTCQIAVAADWYVSYTTGDYIWIADGTCYENKFMVTDGTTLGPLIGDATTVITDAQGGGRAFLLQVLMLATHT